MKTLTWLATLAAAGAMAWSAAALAATATPATQPQRTIYVPYKDLSAVLDPSQKTVLMDRAEFARLMAAAATNAAASGSIELGQVADARYTAAVEGPRLQLTGTLKIVTLSDKPVAVGLPFAGLGLTSLQLDGKPAPLGQDEKGQLALVVTGRGEHVLAVAASGALKELSTGGMSLGLSMPAAVAGELTLTVPGDQTIHATAPVASLKHDAAADATTAVLTVGGLSSVSAVLLGNGRRDDEKAILLAESAFSVQLWPQYQTLTGVATVQVLRRGTRELRFAVEPGWTVTDVSCPDMVKWSIEPAATQPASQPAAGGVLVVRLRTAAKGAQAVQIQAWSPRAGDDWTSPRINLLDADYQRGYLLVGAQQELRIRHETVRDARREDASAAAAAARILAAAGGRLYQHWGRNWQVDLELTTLQRQQSSQQRQTLSVLADQLLLAANFQVTAVGREMYVMTFDLPAQAAAWDVSSVTVDGKQTGFEYRLSPLGAAGADGRELRIELAKPVAAEAAANVQITLRHVPENWKWEQNSPPREIIAPLIGSRADTVSGLAAVSAFADVEVQPASAPAALKPVPIGRMAALGLGAEVALAWEYQQAADGVLKLVLSRRTPRISAGSVGLATVGPTEIVGDFAIRYGITRASTRRVYLLAEKSLARNIRIEPLDGCDIRIIGRDIVEPSGATVELPATLAERFNLWQISLDAPATGIVALAAHYSHAYSAAGHSGRVNLPLVRPIGAERIEELLAIGAGEELAVAVTPTAASDIDAVDLPALPATARRLIAALRLDSPLTPTGAAAAVAAAPTVHQPYPIAEAVVSQATLLTYLGVDGSQRTQADYTLANAGLQFLTVRLPKGAQLWSASVDGAQARPKRGRDADEYLLAVGRTGGGSAKVRIVFAVGGDGGGSLPLAAPVLEGPKVSAMSWQIIPPAGYTLCCDDAAYLAAGGRRLLAVETLPGFLGGNAAPRCNFEAAPHGSAAAESDKADGNQPPPAPVKPAAEQIGKKTGGALGLSMVREGRQTLPVELQPPGECGPAVALWSLGQPPVLSVELQPRWRPRAWWGVGFGIVFVLGVLSLRRRGASRKALMVIGVMAAATLVAAWWPAAGPLADGAFFGALAVAGLYLAALVARLVLRGLGGVWSIVRTKPTAAAGVLLAAMLLSAASAAHAGAAPASAPAPDGAAASPPNVVPYDDPSKLDQADRILVGYGKFVSLWNAAHPDQQIDVLPERSRVAIAAARCAATLDDQKLKLLITAEITTYGTRTVTLPMPVAGLAIVSATLDGKDASLEMSPAGLVLTLPAGTAAAAPITRKLAIEAVAPAKVQGRRGEASFTLPPLPNTLLSVTLAGEDLVLDVAGLDAAPVSRVAGGGQVEWTAPLGQRRDVVMRWSPKAGSGAADRTLTAASAHDVYVLQWAVVGASKISYNFTGGDHDQFTLLAPQDITLTDVAGANIRDWRPAGTLSEGGVEYRVLDVRLHRKASKSYELTVKWLRDVPADGQPTALALPQAGDVARESGSVTLHASGGMSVKVPSATGGRRVTLATGGKSPMMETAVPVAQYIWPYRPFGMAIEVARQQVAVKAELLQLVRISPHNVQLLVDARLSASGGSMFGASFALPDGYEVLSAAGGRIAEWYVQPTPAGRRLHVSFSGGAAAAQVALVLVRNDAALQSLAVPAATLIDADGRPLGAQRGRLAVQVGTSLSAQTLAMENLRATTPSTTAGWLDAAQMAAVQFAYTYDQPNISLQLQVTPKPTTVALEVLAGIALQPAEAQYTYRLRYTIDGSPIDRVAIRMPQRFAALAQVTSPAMRSVASETADGVTTFNVALANEVTGLLDVVVNFASPVDAQTTTLDVPAVWSDHNAGYRAIVAVQNFSPHKLSVRSAPGLSAMAAAEQSAVLSANVLKGLQMVYSGYEPTWSLDVALTPVKAAVRIQAVVDLMELTTVIDRAGSCRYEAKITLQNRSEQFLRVRLGSGLKLWGAHVAGEPVKPAVASQAPADEVLIPLVKTDPGGLPYQVRLMLAGELGGGIDGIAKLSPPAIRIVGVGVMKTTWSLRLPEGYKYIRPSGNMSAMAGTAEKMAVESDALIEQARRLEELASSASSLRSRKLAVGNLKTISKQLKDNIAANEDYVRQNPDELGRDASRLQDWSKSQYGYNKNLESKISELEKQLQDEAASGVNWYVNNTITNGGTLQIARDQALNDVPVFVQQAAKEQLAELAGEKAKLEETVARDTQKLVAGKGDGEGKPGELDLGEADGKQTAEVLDKLRKEQAQVLISRQHELAEQTKIVADNRMNRFYIDQQGQNTAALQAQQAGQTNFGAANMPVSGDATRTGGTGLPAATLNGTLSLDASGSIVVTKPGAAATAPTTQPRGGRGAGSGESGGQMAEAGRGGQGRPEDAARQLDQYVAGGTLSLPMELPEGGLQLDFIRNGGDAELTFWAVRSSFIDGAYVTGGVLIALAALVVAGRAIRSMRRA